MCIECLQFYTQSCTKRHAEFHGTLRPDYGSLLDGSAMGCEIIQSGPIGSTLPHRLGRSICPSTPWASAVHSRRWKDNCPSDDREHGQPGLGRIDVATGRHGTGTVAARTSCCRSPSIHLGSGDAHPIRVCCIRGDRLLENLPQVGDHRGKQGVVTVGFDYQDGKAVNIGISKSSNEHTLDAASVGAVTKASLPPPSPSYAGKTLHMEVIMCYSLNNTDICPSMYNVIYVTGTRIRITTTTTYH